MRHRCRKMNRSENDTTPDSNTPRSPQSSPAHKLPPVPDFNNQRFCRACRAHLHIDAFPPGKRRYICRTHNWQLVKKPSMDRARADPQRKSLWVMWKRCWTDAKRTFKQPRIALQQRDIANALAKPGTAPASQDPTLKYAVVPADPTQIVNPNNLVIVHSDFRKDLLRTYRESGVASYVDAIAKHRV